MKLGNLLALPLAFLADAVTLGEAGVTHRILQDERNQRDIEALEALAKIINAKKK